MCSILQKRAADEAAPSLVTTVSPNISRAELQLASNNLVMSRVNE